MENNKNVILFIVELVLCFFSMYWSDGRDELWLHHFYDTISYSLWTEMEYAGR